MLETTRAVRVAAVLTAVAAVGLALGIRALAGGTLMSNGALQQNTGTALYASAVYASVVFLAPRMRPAMAGLIAVGACWALEFFQLTGVPHELSKYSILIRLVLGDAFDWIDVWWYPAGVVPLVLVEMVARTRGGRLRWP
ncbi:DUF2809 domain-containing protein [Dactylosporangium sp. CA-233914]|uniref:ribosomal maturation YjgA family protein n=1 Tax=Dactylosporangium sp. CA-233914 TaxID=3239934 RepID=UPI003D89EA02